MIDNLKSSSLRIDPELTQLETKRAELEKELENVKAAIDRHRSNLVQIPNAIKQKNTGTADQGQRSQGHL